VRARHKKWALPFLEEHPELVVNKIDPKSDFFKKVKFLEIGSGKGDFALALASSHPNENVLALERDTSICGIFAKKAVDAGVTNLAIMDQDFDKVYEELKQLRFDVIFLNFSDPWPKKKHWKRRLTTSSRLLEMKELLTPNGEIRIKTDNDSLYEFSLLQAPLAGLDIKDNQPIYEFDGTNDYMSEYERNFRLVNKSIHRLVLVKGKKE
jgi:tRNA (guanine-N7-)-methyltransferase